MTSFQTIFRWIFLEYYESANANPHFHAEPGAIIVFPGETFGYFSATI